MRFRGGALETIKNLKRWLLSRGLDGPGVDSRISVVYCPGKMGNLFNNKVAHVLDKAGKFPVIT